MYTQAELDKAIEQLVRTTIRRPYGALGNRRIDQTFGDVQDAAAGVFLARNNAPYYVVFLAAQRLQDTVDEVQAVLEDLIDAFREVGRSVRPVDDLSPLANAKAALDALAQAAGERSSSFASILEVPAFQRFETNSGRFLSAVGSRLVSGATIVRTPTEARAVVARRYVELQESSVELSRLATILEGAIAEYELLSLGPTILSSIVENARGALSARLTELQGLTPVDRLSVIREVALDVLAARSTVRGFGSLEGPTTFVNLTGSGSVFADEARPAIPAAIVADILSPYPLVSDTLTLDVTTESASLSVQLPAGYVAFSDGFVPPPYELVAGADTLRLRVTNYPSPGQSTDVDVVFGPGTFRTNNVTNALNAAISAASGATRIPITAEPAVLGLKASVEANIVFAAGVSGFTATNGEVDFEELGVIAGDFVLVRDPENAAFESYYEVTGVSGGTIAAEVFPGPYDTLGSPGASVIDVGTTVVPRVRVSSAVDAARTTQPSPPFQDYRQQAMVDRLTIEIPTDGPGTAALQSKTAAILGFPVGATFISSGVRASAVAQVFNSSSSAVSGGVLRAEASTSFVPTHYSGRASTVPTDFLRVSAPKFSATGDMTSDTIHVTVSVSGALTAGVVVGDQLAIRSTPLGVADYGPITAVSDTEITATIGGLSSETDVVIEVGPDLSAAVGATARLTNFSGNDLDYLVLSVGPAAFDLSLDAPLPFPSAPGNLPIEGDLEVGRFALQLASTGQEVNTSIAVTASDASPFLFSSGTATSVGTTAYFQLPGTPPTLQEGDTLELYPSDYSTPSTSVTIVGISSDGVVELDTPLPTDTPSYDFGVGLHVPFARVRGQRNNQYAQFSAALTAWLEGETNQPGFYTNFNRAVNAVLVNRNPSALQVADAVAEAEKVLSSLQFLTEAIGNYQVEPVPEVDALISSYVQDGADRAADILLEARFVDFFGLDRFDASYSGSVEKAVREVAREDLPVRADNRVGELNGDMDVVGSFEEQDFEYDTTDTDEVQRVDFIPSNDQDLPFSPL